MGDVQLVFRPKDAPVSYQEVSRNSQFAPDHIHVHNSHELCFVPTACAFHVFSGGNRFKVQGPALLFHRAGCFHELLSIDAGAEYKSHVVHFFKESLPDPSTYLPPYDCSIFSLTEDACKILSLYFSLVASESPTRQPMVVLLILDKLRECSDHIIGSNSADSYIFAVLRQLLEYPDQNLTILQLANAHHVSPSKLKQDFSSITGMPIRQYMIRQRLQLACKLLEHREYSLAQIAYRCGFCSQSHFTAAFRAQFGITPGQYIKGGYHHV